MEDSSLDGHLPQFARLEAARLIVSQAANGAAATYRLTLPEVAYVLEGVLSDFRGSLLALGASQLSRPAPAREEQAPETVKPAKKAS